ncbi:WD repeat-containing protein 87 [Phlyctochytrium planicorne]|nr:WD repeat-containing protein 87 [Phlyctochytrium planicorne]
MPDANANEASLAEGADGVGGNLENHAAAETQEANLDEEFGDNEDAGMDDDDIGSLGSSPHEEVNVRSDSLGDDIESAHGGGGGGLEQETVLVFPWKRVKHIIQPLASRTPAPPPTAPAGNHQNPQARKRKMVAGTRPQTEAGASPNGKQKQKAEDGSVKPQTSVTEGSLRPQTLNSRDPPPTRDVRAKSDVDVEEMSLMEVGRSDNEEGDDDEEEEEEEGLGGSVGYRRQARQPLGASGSHLIAITIPHGFQQVRTLLMPKPTLKSVIYVSSTNTDAFAALDTHGVHLVRGTVRVMNMATGGDKGNVQTPVAGLSRWIYIKKWRMTIIATLHLELKILGLSMEEVSSVSSVKPVLSLEFNEDKEELIAGGVGNIRVYDYTTGKRIEGVRNAHELSISAMCLYEPLEYLITGSRDSANRVTVWNLNRYYTTFSFLNSQVTHLSRVELKYRPARIVAAAADGSIRLLSPVTGAVLSTAFPAMKETFISAVEYDLATDILWALTTAGDIAVYTCRSNPSQIIDEWKFVVGREKVTCLTSLRATPPRAISSRAVAAASTITEPEVKTSSTPAYLSIPQHPVYALIGGTDTGQILMLDIRAGGGRQDILIQAHTADITGIKCISNTMTLITSASDGTIKMWRIAFTEYAQAIYGLKSSQSSPPGREATPNSKDAGDLLDSLRSAQQGPLLSITPISTISTQFTLTLPLSVSTAMCYSLKTSTIAIGTDSSHLLIYRSNSDGLNGLIRRHPADEDHTKVITSITCLEALGLFATSSLDGTVKIWDSNESALVREIQFNEPLSAVTFCNRRGDLLVGMSDQVALVRLQDYLPSHYLGLLIAHGDSWVDDVVEYPHKFDSGLDFWELYREGLEQDGADLSHWHVQRKRQREDFDSETMRKIEELEKKRAIAEANRKRRKLLREREMERLKQQILYTVQGQSDEYGGSGGAGGWTVSRRDTPKGDDDIDEEDEDEDLESSIGTNDDTHSDDRKHEDKGSDKGVFDDIYNDEEEASMRKNAGRDRRKSMAPALANRKADNKKLKEMYGLDGKGRRSSIAKNALGGGGGGVEFTGGLGGFGDEENSPPATGSSSGPGPKLRFTLPQVTGTEGGARQTGVLRTFQEVKTEQMGTMLHPVRLERHPTFVDEKSAAEQRQEQIQAARMAAMAEVANPFARGGMPHGAPGATIIQMGSEKKETPPVRHWIRERMAKMGILPNSVIASQIQEDKRKRMRELQEQREKLESEKNAASAATNLNPFQRPKHLQSRRPKKPELVIEMGIKEDTHVDLQDDGEEDKEAEKQRLEAQRQKDALARLQQIEIEEKAAAAERLLEREREAAIELAKRREKERIDREEMEAIQRAKEEEDIRLQKEAEEMAKAAAEAARIAKMNYLAEMAAKEAEANQAKPPEKKPEVPLPNLKDLRDRMPIGMPKALKKKLPPPPVAETKPKPPEVKKPPPVERPKPVVVVEEKIEQRVEKIPPELLESVDSVTESNDEDLPLPNLEAAFTPEDVMEKKLEAKHAWGLFEKAVTIDTDGSATLALSVPVVQIKQSYDDMAAELNNVINNFWFPGLGGKAVNLKNIIEVLFKLMKNGLWSEKCEASKAVLYLYHTFERDFLDPMTTLIYPQLEFTNDEAWQFRAQMCLNLVGYKIHHLDIIQSLICRLNDKVEAVRKIAKKSLAQFGIDSKHALKSVMVELHMLPPEASMEHSDWLDVLLERMHQQLRDRIIETNDIILKWRSILHPSTYGKEVERPASCWATLVRPDSNHDELYNERAVMEAVRNTGWGMPLSSLDTGKVKGSRMVGFGSRGGNFVSKARLAGSNYSKSQFLGSSMSSSTNLGGSTLKLSMNALGSNQLNSGHGNALLTTTRAVEFPMHASRMASGIRLAIATERQIQHQHHHNTISGAMPLHHSNSQTIGEGEEPSSPETNDMGLPPLPSLAVSKAPEDVPKISIQTPGSKPSTTSSSGSFHSNGSSQDRVIPTFVVEVDDGTFQPGAWSDNGTVAGDNDGVSKRVAFKFN